MESEFGRLLDALPAPVWTTGPDGTPDFVNKAWRDYTGLSLDGVKASQWTSTFHPDDLSIALDSWSNALAGEARHLVEVRLRRFDGAYRHFSIEARPQHDAAGGIVGWCGINTDIEDQKRAEAQLAAEKQLFELIARGTPLPGFLEGLCTQVERLSPGSLCSVLFIDAERKHFRVGAGPNLPDGYNAALEGLKIDANFGPCSRAVETRSTIVVVDPASDPRWGPVWPSLMVEHGLASCWSAPVFGSSDEVLGIFAIYRREAEGPNPGEQELIDRFAKIAGIAIDRAQSDTALDAGETDLRRSHHFLNGAQRLSKTGSFSLDTSTDEQIWSEENYRIWEYDPTVPPNMDMVAASLHPEDREATLGLFAEATAAEQDFEVFYRIVTPIGGVKHLHTVMEIIPEFTDRIVYLGSSQDVTESKLAEEALKASEAGLRRANQYLAGAQKLSKTGSFTWDVATDDQDWSEELYRIWEMEPADDRAVPNLHATVLHPDDVPGVEAIMEPALEAGRDYEVSYRIITPSGAVKHLHTVNQRVAEITDRLVYIGATQDLTESRLAEEALKASEARLQRAHDHLAQAQQLSQTGSFTTDFETDTHVWSDELYRILEFEVGTPVSFKDFRSLIHPDDQALFSAGFQPTIKDGVDFDQVFRLTTPNGTAKYLHAVAKRLEGPPAAVFMGSIQDVTESKLAEEALRASEARLARANQYLAGAQKLSKTGSFTWDVATDEQDWSEELYRIWGLEPGDDRSVATLHATVVHPDDVPLIKAIAGPAIEERRGYEISYRIVTRDGAIKHLHTVRDPVPDITDRLVYVGATQDLTESRLAEEALKASEAGLRRANDHLAQAQSLSQTGSHTSDFENDIHLWSDELYRILEFEPDFDINYEAFRSRIHPDDLARYETGFLAAIEDGEDFHQTFRWLTPKGNMKFLHSIAQWIEGSSPRIFLGSIQDVTEGKLAEEALKRSEAGLTRANRYLTAAQTLSRIGSFTWDLDTDELDWSDENYRIWGVDPATPPTMDTIFNGIHPEDLSRVAAIIADGKRTGGDFDVFYRIVTPAGEIKHIHTVSTRIPEVTDRLLYIGSNQDVTESKLAEAELARANTYLVAAQRLSQTGSFTWDVAADDHNWSEVIYSVFGFEPGTKVTMDMMMPAIHPEDLPQVEALITGAAIGENFDLTFRVIRPAGDIRYAQVVGHRIDNIPDRPVFMGALQDITARKLAEDDLNRARAELAHVARVTALSALTASIAHEVNQPLAGIITNASTCLRMLATDPPDIIGARATAQRTIRDGNRASDVIKRLRALFARKEPSLEPIDLNDAAREVLTLSTSELRQRKILVRTDLADDLPPVWGDKVQLQQVILNLILNAADAMDGVDDRSRELRLATVPGPAPLATLRVQDAGVGFDAEVAGRLFDAFHTTKPDGMGIGLSISRSIVESHGGRIEAVPNDGAPGATFSFSIPCAARPAAELELRKL